MRAWVALAGGIALAAVGCAKEEAPPAAETCARFGDAAGQCTVGAVEGRARLDGTATHGGIRVSLVGTDHGTIASEDGAYSLEKIPPGEYVVSFDADGFVPRTSRATVRARHVTRIVEMVLSRAKVASRVGGRILLEGRTSFAGTMVSLDGTGIATFTEDDGAFAFSNVPLGAVRLTAAHPGFESTRIEIEADRWEVEAGVHTLAPLPAPGAVTGSVWASAVPVEGASVVLAGTAFGATTGPDGAFSIDEVEPGSHELVVVAPGWIPASVAVDVAPGRQIVVPRIDLVAAGDVGRMRGFARRVGEATRGGIEVELVEGDVVVASGTTDETGTYHLSSAPSGVYSLVARAPGFPDVVLPGVALGPGDWQGPELALRRSVRIDPRRGTGTTTPSGRWAVVTYESGSAGTWLWNAAARTQRKILPAPATLVAVDREEAFATLLVGTTGSPALARVELATGNVQEVLPRPDRIFGSYGSSTFYRSVGILYRLLAGDSVARRIDVPPFRSAAIENAHGSRGWLALASYDEPPIYFRLPFDSEQHWNGPALLSTFGSSLDSTLGWAVDGRIYWVDVPGRRSVLISSSVAHAVLQANGRTFVAEGYDPIRGHFDLLVVDPETGESQVFLSRVIDAWRLGESTLVFAMSDRRFLWLADDGRSSTPITICAGGTTSMKSKSFACLEDGTGRVRVADDSGVKTLSQSATSLEFINEEVLAWTEPGDEDALHLGSLDRHVVRVPCAGRLLGVEGSGLYQVLYCGDGIPNVARFVDLAAETVSLLEGELILACSVAPAGHALVCLHFEGFGQETMRPILRAYDHRSGVSTDTPFPSANLSALRNARWAPSGRAAVFPNANEVVQLRFSDTGAPEWSHCIPPQIGRPGAGEIVDFDDEARVLWSADSGLFHCDREGLGNRVGPYDDGRLVRLGDSGWSLWGGDTGNVVNLSHGTSYPAGVAPRGWWVPPGDDSVYMVDSIGLRRFRSDGGVDLLQEAVHPLYRFDRVPLLETTAGVQRIAEDGNLIPIASATAVASGPFGSERSWFAGADGDLYVIDLNTGAVDRVAEGVDLARFFDASGRGLYFEGEVEGVRGLYRLSPDDTTMVRLLDGAEVGRVDESYAWFFDGPSMWIEHGDVALLVHDEGPGAGWVAPSFERAFLFPSDPPGTWWFSLP